MSDKEIYERTAVLETDLKNTKEDVDGLKGCFKELTKEIRIFHSQIHRWIRYGVIGVCIILVELRVNFSSILVNVLKGM